MDRHLVERARSGDQEAFADLVHQVSDTLLGVARRILRDPRSRRGRAAERPADDLAEAPAPAGRRPLRGMGLPDSCSRLLRGRTAQPAMGIDHSRASHRRRERRRRHPDGLRPRRAGAGLPPAPARPARGLRAAPPRGPAPRGGGRNARHPGRDGAIAVALRDPGAPRCFRGGAAQTQNSDRDDWHERRPRLRASRSGVAQRRLRSTPPHVIDAVLLAAGARHRNGISESRGGLQP